MYRKGQKPDHYTEQAKKLGYPARSVFKLKEIDKKYKIFKKNDKVLDLGAAPGSWSKYVAQKVGNSGLVVAVDIDDLKIFDIKNIKFIKKDVFSAEGGSAFGGSFPEKFSAVISDMAPKTTGVAFVDEGKSLELAEQAFKLTKLFLQPGGSFVCKIFESKDSTDFFKQVKKYFEFSKRFKPKAVVKNSKELYIVCTNFKKLL